MGDIFSFFCKRGQALRQLERGNLPAKGTGARIAAKREVTKGNFLAGKKRVGIVLFQLGGPDSLGAVEPFLRNLFLDPDIIPMGPLGFLRKPLANYIAKKRSVSVRGRYAMIGHRSPIGILTERQRRALVAALSRDLDVVAVTAMRYWKPLTSDAIESLRVAGPLDEIVLLPLYPHFSYATTLSSLKEWKRGYGEQPNGPPQKTVSQFYNHPLY